MTGNISPGSGQADLNALLANGSGTVVLPSGTFRVTAPPIVGGGVTEIIGDDTVVDGAVVLDAGWAPQGGGRWALDGWLPEPYTDPGQPEKPSGLTGNNAEVCQCCEDMWADGAPLKRVMHLGELVPGTFFQDYRANRIWVADDPTANAMEMAVARYGFLLNAPGVTVRGLMVQRCANKSQTGAFTANSDATLVDVDTRWNHARGLTLNYATTATLVQGGTDLENGQLGMARYGCRGDVVEGRQFLRNNPDAKYRILDWESGGFKWARCTGGHTNDCTAVGNRGVCMWHDSGNTDETISRPKIFGTQPTEFGSRSGTGRSCSAERSSATASSRPPRGERARRCSRARRSTSATPTAQPRWPARPSLRP